MTGPFNGLQAEPALTPYAASSLVKLPDDLDDDRAILHSDIFPTGQFGAELAEIEDGNTVAVSPATSGRSHRSRRRKARCRP